MINIDNLNGTKLKNILGAKRVRKIYHNKHRSGSGNFGYVVIFYPDDWFRFDGSYSSSGYILDLRVSTYGSRDINNSLEAQRIDMINKALFTFSDGYKSEPEIPKNLITILDVKRIERENVLLRKGNIPTGKLDIIHYYLLEDANFHTLNNQLTKMGKFGPFKTNKYSMGIVYSPKKYGSPLNEERFKQYQRLGGRTWEL